MANLNKVLLIGNLTRDPEPRFTPSGTQVTTFDIAINRTYRTKDGEKKEETCFVTIETWGRQAETCAEYLHKGSPVFVEGRLKFSKWESQTGEKRSKLEVTAERVQFLGGRKPEESYLEKKNEGEKEEKEKGEGET